MNKPNIYFNFLCIRNINKIKLAGVVQLFKSSQVFKFKFITKNIQKIKNGV